jgi:hypothetical protein
MPPAPGTIVATKPWFFTVAQSSGPTKSSPKIPSFAAVAAICSTSIPVLRKQPRQIDCLIRPFFTTLPVSAFARDETAPTTVAAPTQLAV